MFFSLKTEFISVFLLGKFCYIFDINLNYIYNQIINWGSMKKLVVYFSATNTTKKLAQKLAKVINADLFEIEPTNPYTSEDLNWNNKNCRTTLEMNDLSSRPQIKNKLSSIEEYDTIFVGFPIWWYNVPTIINTFLEQYNFENKTIVPFATSGGTTMGNLSERLKLSAKNAKVLKGKRFSSSASEDELKNFADNLI